MSLAYDNIYDRVVLFTGDGDYHDTLDHLRNIMRKEIWIIGRIKRPPNGWIPKEYLLCAFSS